jgi:SnoaL-like domain
MNTEALVEIERIKQLKARYFRLFDTKKWSEWADVLTEDCQVRFGEDERDPWIVGRHRIAKVMERAIGDGVTVHHGHTPEIELTSDTTATGIWAMVDYVETTGESPLRHKGYGHYHESYERGADNQWRIARLQLTRLRVDPLT